MSNEFKKKNKNLLFCKKKKKKQISHMANACVRESVRTQDMGHGM